MTNKRSEQPKSQEAVQPARAGDELTTENIEFIASQFRGKFQTAASLLHGSGDTPLVSPEAHRVNQLLENEGKTRLRTTRDVHESNLRPDHKRLILIAEGAQLIKRQYEEKFRDNDLAYLFCCIMNLALNNRKKYFEEQMRDDKEKALAATECARAFGEMVCYVLNNYCQNGNRFDGEIRFLMETLWEMAEPFFNEENMEWLKNGMRREVFVGSSLIECGMHVQHAPCELDLAGVDFIVRTEKDTVSLQVKPGWTPEGSLSVLATQMEIPSILLQPAIQRQYPVARHYLVNIEPSMVATTLYDNFTGVATQVPDSEKARILKALDLE